MPWYAAHVIVSTRPIKRIDGEISVYENVLLIEAVDDDEAGSKAKKYGEASVVEDETLRIDREPAEQRFVGVRKIIEIRGPVSSDVDEPIDGAEITYSKISVKDEETLAKLANGEEVVVEYLE
jgi:hypothetical protein